MANIPTEKLNKLMVQCQSPKTIPNRYTRELVTVPCGVCPACLLRRANLRTALLSNWASNFKYRYFVTLTYKNEFLPMFRIIKAEVSSDDPADVPCLDNVTPDTGIMYVAKQVPRRYSVKVKNSTVWRSFNQDKDSAEAFWFYSTPREMQVYYDKVACHRPDCLPCVNYRDVDLFLKRLRSYYNENEAFKYYSTAEYGPAHLRPHYHLLILTNSEHVSDTLAENVRKAWQYGRTDCQLSRGFCASYVASYINNDVYLPRLYQLMPPATRPQSHHSKGWQESKLFPQHALSASYEVLYDTCLNGIDVCRDGDVQTLLPSWAYINRVFPRFTDAVRNNPSFCGLLLRATLTTSERMCRRSAPVEMDLMDGNSLCRYACEYAKYVSSAFYRYRTFKMSPAERNEFERTDLYIIKECRCERDIVLLCCKEDYSINDRCVGAFYRHFLRCRKFFDFWLINDAVYDSEAIYALSHWIGDYWKAYEYKRMAESLDFMQDIADMDVLRYLHRMYADCRRTPLDKDDENRFADVLKNMTSQRIKDRCKHKEMNDANNALFDNV